MLGFRIALGPVSFLCSKGLVHVDRLGTDTEL
jgi:hypothetical protein